MAEEVTRDPVEEQTENATAEATTQSTTEPSVEEEKRLEPSAPPFEDETLSPPSNGILKHETESSKYNGFNPEDLRPTFPTPPPQVKPCPPTIFGHVPEGCVTFCIDTSGSMFNTLHVVKEHLMETLSSLAEREDQMFNLIEFNSQVTQWADKLVQCTPETVSVAQSWVNNLSAKTGTNMLDALLTAFADPSCQAVYLVSDGPPDQYPDEVLDRVVAVSGNRSVHCIYIAGEKANEAATEFLEDLAVETFGSFHIVTLTTHGCVERVTPIYRSDHAHERIVRTVNNTLRPAMKACSVSTTLQIDPDEILGLAPRTSALVHPVYPYNIPPALLPTVPYRYYYPHYWSRYRPAKHWLQAQDKLDTRFLGLSPSAGSLLVGKKVIARRIDDGYLYKATVQSQNLGEKFLIAFGPCKHGKYRQTEYQDTYVFDIVDYHDALRHTIINGDKVLAPWEPEGERFATGIVIEGQEKRHADGPADKDLTVSFCNGRTETVPRDVAVWIPDSVYERLSLELQMPTEARKNLLSTADNYPLENLPGYPVSKPTDDPSEYPTVEPPVIEANSYVWDPYFYRYPLHMPPYYGYPPFIVARSPHSSGQDQESDKGIGRKTDDPESLIPGTGLTRQELDDRIMSQLMEHRLRGAEEKVRQESVIVERPSSRLLDRREKTEEKTLKKTVTFQDSVAEEESHTSGERMKMRYVSEEEEDDYDEYGNPVNLVDAGVNTDSSLLFYRSPGIKGRPQWKKYWRNDSSPPYCGSLGGGSVSTAQMTGPFRETALQAPLEVRDQRTPPYDVEWTSPAFKYVDFLAKHDYSNSVEECLKTPHPPSKAQTRIITYGRTVPSKPVAVMTPEERQEARRANRRRRVLRREEAWQARIQDEDNMKSLMQDNHRARIMAQMERDRQRQIKEQEDIYRAREGKKKISKELKDRIEMNQKIELEKEDKRIEALRQRRERREAIQAQRERDIQDTVERREAIRKQNNQARLISWTEKMNQQDEKEAALQKQHQEAKIHRINHFRELERQGQEQKDRRIVVTEQNRAILRSQIFA